MTADGEQGTASDAEQRIEAHYVRSQFCRVVAIHGAIGSGHTEKGIHAALYSEYLALPDSVSYALSPEGVGRELPLDVPRAITREVEVQLIMDVDVAERIARWLMSKVAEIRDIDAKIAESQAE